MLKKCDLFIKTLSLKIADYLSIFYMHLLNALNDNLYRFKY